MVVLVDENLISKVGQSCATVSLVTVGQCFMVLRWVPQQKDAGDQLEEHLRGTYDFKDPWVPRKAARWLPHSTN